MCPECGRPFDPAIRSSHLRSTSERFGKFNWMTAILATLPLLMPLMILVTWGLAWIALGHRPVPSINDPKAIDSTLMQSAYIGTILLMVMVPPAFFLTIIMILASGIRVLFDRYRLRGFLILLAYSITSIALAYILVIDMPYDIGIWFMD